jgi:hypothetical protein
MESEPQAPQAGSGGNRPSMPVRRGVQGRALAYAQKIPGLTAMKLFRMDDQLEGAITSFLIVYLINSTA